MNKNEWIAEILDRLKAEYPDADCPLEHDSVYQLLVAVTLSAQTTDNAVNKVTPELFMRWPKPADMAVADPGEVAKTIKAIGLYKTKSKNIIKQAQMIMSDFEGKVPEDDELLVHLPGVGRKTANVVMADGFGHQRMAVDTHVFRVANRIGLAKSDDVKKTEEQLVKALPHESLTAAHHELIFHGRRCCHARKPECDRCVLGDLCKKRGVSTRY